MRDIDFDELDRAVNRFLGKLEKVEKQLLEFIKRIGG